MGRNDISLQFWGKPSSASEPNSGQLKDTFVPQYGINKKYIYATECSRKQTLPDNTGGSVHWHMPGIATYLWFLNYSLW